VSRREKELIRGVVWWMAVAIPATYTNSMISYLKNKLAIALRTQLTNYLHGHYLENLTFYKVNNLDDRIQNVDK
jgi:ATP-binding cassette subfamily D (ALD) long-chain fatty acid import protein